MNLEATLQAVHPLAVRDDERRGGLVALEVRIERVHVAEGVRMAGHADRIDPDRWRPIIMSFQQLYGLSGRLRPSRLAEIDESSYRPRRLAVA
ncbi:MAG TPA: hypothetical protein VEW03_01805 [Longimicrobiaceae bacterium]|nr:hypothetical protein [Longimicrobiaceae bacterium]